MARICSVFLALVASMALFAVGGSATAAAAQAYTITDLGQPPMQGVNDRIVVSAVNAHEQVVGSMNGQGGTFGQHYGFEWQSGSGIRVLPGESATVLSLSARGINDYGQIAGAGFGAPFAPGPTLYALLWQPGGTVLQLGTPSAQASAINNKGQVVGSQTGRAFLWDATDGAVDIGAFSPTAINKTGHVAGNTPQGHAMVWDQVAGVVDLGTLTDSVQSSAASINEREQVVGTSFGTNGAPDRAFIWDAQQGMRALPLLPGTTSNQATGISAGGRVVGTASSMAFTWRPEGGAQALPGLPGIDTAHGMLNISISAGAINYKGEIAGVVSWTLADNSSTVYNHLVLWRPVPSADTASAAD